MPKSLSDSDIHKLPGRITDRDLAAQAFLNAIKSDGFGPSSGPTVTGGGRALPRGPKITGPGRPKPKPKKGKVSLGGAKNKKVLLTSAQIRAKKKAKARGKT
jgi:hypothetical protein